jgi:hypothetical protein
MKAKLSAHRPEGLTGNKFFAENLRDVLRKVSYEGKTLRRFLKWETLRILFSCAANIHTEIKLDKTYESKQPFQISRRLDSRLAEKAPTW